MRHQPRIDEDEIDTIFPSSAENVGAGHFIFYKSGAVEFWKYDLLADSYKSLIFRKEPQA